MIGARSNPLNIHASCDNKESSQARGYLEYNCDSCEARVQITQKNYYRKSGVGYFIP